MKTKPESNAIRSFPWVLIVLVLLAFALRLHSLGASSLRGDEAFAIRYWAQSPATVWATLAGTEPHPLGTFTLFWAWKSLVGDSEFAMRMLPLLGNLIGLPAMAVLGRRLFKSWTVGWVAAFLWAVNPNLIWHSQDVRNYAIWAGISAVNLWLLLRATQRARRIDWVLYILSMTLGLYIFFLEAFILVVHGLYVVMCHRRQFHRWLIAVLIISVLLIPWFAQAWALAHSGYSGTAARADLGALWTQFFPTLWLGEAGNIGSAALQIFLVTVFIIALTYSWLRQRRAVIFSVLFLAIPTLLLIFAATKLDVFRPRYLIAVTPALLLPVAYAGVAVWRNNRRVSRLGVALISAALIGVWAATLVYYFSGYQKAPDWRALGILLRQNTTAKDAVIVVSTDSNGSIDPAFDYYYRGPASVQVMPYKDVDAEAAIALALASHQTVYVVPLGKMNEYDISTLNRDGSLLEDETVDQFHVQIYRDKDIRSDKIADPLNLAFGSALLKGYSLLGSPKSGSTLIVLLYWQTPPPQNLKVFVHLLGAPNANGSPLWAQDDHPAQPGRDPYIIDLVGVPSGGYTLELGVYDTVTGQRVTITNADSGTRIGDSGKLQDIEVAP